jgi:hypothetical protein
MRIEGKVIPLPDDDEQDRVPACDAAVGNLVL